AMPTRQNSPLDRLAMAGTLTIIWRPCRPHPRGRHTLCGRSSGVEHNLAKVGVEGSNPFARSNKTAETRHFLRVAGFSLGPHLAFSGPPRPQEAKGADTLLTHRGGGRSLCSE